MVRYERFGLGQTWNVEYGSASDPVQFSWLLSYSPYHHVVPGTAYPAVLFTVFTNDTRVDPVHAYKMCASLQHASVSGRPVLLRAEGQVGHGARAVSRTAELAGDTLAFAARYTGLVVAVIALVGLPRVLASRGVARLRRELCVLMPPAWFQAR